MITVGKDDVQFNDGHHKMQCEYRVVFRILQPWDKKKQFLIEKKGEISGSREIQGRVNDIAGLLNFKPMYQMFTNVYRKNDSECERGRVDQSGILCLRLRCILNILRKIFRKFALLKYQLDNISYYLVMWWLEHYFFNAHETLLQKCFS